jgi:hypothetical protein
MRYVIAVLAVAGIVVSCLALAVHYGPPAQPIDLMHSAWNSAYVNQSPFATVYGLPVALLGVAGYLFGCSRVAASRSPHGLLCWDWACLRALPHKYRSAHSARVVCLLCCLVDPDCGDSSPRLRGAAL